MYSQHHFVKLFVGWFVNEHDHLKRFTYCLENLLLSLRAEAFNTSAHLWTNKTSNIK